MLQLPPPHQISPYVHVIVVIVYFTKIKFQRMCLLFVGGWTLLELTQRAEPYLQNELYYHWLAMVSSWNKVLLTEMVNESHIHRSKIPQTSPKWSAVLQCTHHLQKRDESMQDILVVQKGKTCIYA